MYTIATVVGARPQFIKASALSRLFSVHSKIREILIHTGQHYDLQMSDVFFRDLELPRPHFNLEIGSHDHGKQTGLMIQKLEEVLDEIQPNAVMVYGDTNSTLAGALTAAKKHIPIFHVEAGLRSFEKNMPEEINRILTDHMSTVLFCPTSTAIHNLKNEGLFHHDKLPHSINQPGIFLTGDIMYDVALYYQHKAETESLILHQLNLQPNSFFLVTIHRSENTDNRLKLALLVELLEKIASYFQLPVVFPIHPRTQKMIHEFELFDKLKKLSNLVLTNPLSYLDMIQLESNSRLILTDSGGVQKEAYFFKKPCYVLRKETEWVELLEQKKARLWMYDNQKALADIEELITIDNENFAAVFGDGMAANRILSIIENEILFNEP
ncbi:MAG: UDP-N-acetylglucosamine 2-epimerase (non-hydrolyzing) [Bacteroidales bacterium]|nr:UDP-N-acetylglucosamine 2-epimerase (non-hydrolyzing) [Bacteroidales bacterium]